MLARPPRGSSSQRSLQRCPEEQPGVSLSRCPERLRSQGHHPPQHLEKREGDLRMGDRWASGRLLGPGATLAKPCT